MKYLEHRRHSIRQSEEDSQSFLSQAGIDLARRVGDDMMSQQKSFAMVVTSILPRAIQTPMAMGYAVDETNEKFTSFGGDIGAELKAHDLDFYSPYTKVVSVVKPGSLFESYGNDQIELYKEYLSRIDDGQSILFATHGGVIDYPLFTMFPDADVSSWGDLISYCEGYRVGFDGTNFVDLEFLRV